MNPYYDDGTCTIFHAPAAEVVEHLISRAASIDLVLTDPPYAEETHDNARTNRGGGRVATGVKLINFGALDFDEFRDLLGTLTAVARRWYVATMDWRHVARLESDPPAGWRFMRFGVWVKPNAMPQISSDRPGTGWEAICCMHRDGLKPEWNGGSRPGVWVYNHVQAARYETEKPESLIGSLVELFSNPGDLIFDPFIGSGTSLRVAKNFGRRAIGCDISEQACEIAAERLRQPVLLPAVAVPNETQADLFEAAA